MVVVQILAESLFDKGADCCHLPAPEYPFFGAPLYLSSNLYVWKRTNPVHTVTSGFVDGDPRTAENDEHEKALPISGC